jgi:hypothetical protein
MLFVTAGRKQVDEETVTVRVYRKDFNTVVKFMVKKGIKNNADGMRVAIQYADSHGALS